MGIYDSYGGMRAGDFDTDGGHYLFEAVKPVRDPKKRVFNGVKFLFFWLKRAVCSDRKLAGSSLKSI